MSPSEFSLQVATNDRVTEITVLDARQNRVVTGVGPVKAALPAGLYKVRARLGPAVQEQLLALDQDQTLILSEGDFRFATPVPLANTARTHEYHQQAAIEASKSKPVAVGDGSTILIFARDWSPGETTTGDPLQGLALYDAAGSGPLVAGGKPLDLSQSADHRQKGDVSAGIRVSVDPGAYRLRVTLANGEAYERILIAVRGWQTQIFLFVRDYDGDRRADLESGAIVMGADSSVFNPDGRGERVAVLARYALTQNRRIADGVYRELYELKFVDPILGLLAAHLLLRDEPENRTRDEVLKNLRRMLGEDHPDVWALDLAGQPASPAHAALRWPPLLRASWDIVCAASVARPTIISEDPIFESVQCSVTPSLPWLTWRANDLAAQRVREDSGPRPPDRKLEALKAFVIAHERSSKWSGPSSGIRAPNAGIAMESVSTAEALPTGAGTSDLDNATKVELTRSLGVTGARLETLLSRVRDDAKESGSLDSSAH